MDARTVDIVDDSAPSDERAAIEFDASALAFARGPEGSSSLEITLPSATGTRPDLAGQVIDGRYRLERPIGVGGMGQVFLGRHLTLDVPIAVKVMHASIASIPENVVRFRREARAASLLQHRNVVRVLDFGDAAGLLYIVMEYLDGGSLGDALVPIKPRLSLIEVEEICDQILAALEAAHSLGIVHRDLKPDNVFLVNEPGGERVVKVVDFGLALVDDARPGTDRLTQTDAVAGTPLYMSPEQCRSLDVTFSTDLYALGCILTEMLQGAPPFEGRGPMDVMTKQLFMPPPPLRRAADREPVPEMLERLRLDLLEKEPDRRPGSATEARRRLALAMDPEASARALPGRQRDGRLARDLRAPSWSGRAAAEERGPIASRAIQIVSLGAAPVLEDAVIVGLRASGFDASRAGDSASSPTVIVLDAGSDITGAASWLASTGRPAAPVIVCARASALDLPPLIGAGAAEVVAAPVDVPTLVKRIERVLRRKR